MSSGEHLRRVRFVCISDTHNQTPKLPAGDVLIHAGDLTNQGSFSELEKTVQWLEQADFQAKIVVAGNHDVTLDEKFYEQYGNYFHHRNMEDSQKCKALLKFSSSIQYLDNESKTIHLTFADGVSTKFKIFGSPFSPSRNLWAFGCAPEDAYGLWQKIPLDSDIVITHTPARHHLDESGTRGATGCPKLREALWRVRPRLAICGHIHEARGVEAVLWDLDAANVKFKECRTRRWEDPFPDSKKQYLVDLSHRSKAPLLNDGSVGHLVRPPIASKASLSSKMLDMDGAAETSARPDTMPIPTSRISMPFPTFEKAVPAISPSKRDGEEDENERNHPIGLCTDQEAIAGREGRRETCFVNAAIMANSWPHKTGKRFNKPIVIDIDFPENETADS